MDGWLQQSKFAANVLQQFYQVENIRGILMSGVSFIFVYDKHKSIKDTCRFLLQNELTYVLIIYAPVLSSPQWN